MTTSSPWLGGPGARWAQVLLFLLHIALLVALVILVFTLKDMRERIPHEPWQEWLVWAVISASFAAFGQRAWRIGQDLWRAARGQEPPVHDEDDS